MKRIRISRAGNGTPPPSTEEKDLGLGSRVASTATTRFLNRDGTFNVVQAGVLRSQSLSLYHTLLTMSGRLFFTMIGLGYLGMNALFAILYFASGSDALKGSTAITLSDRLLESFFFSIHTSATIGYGSLSPHGITANLLVTVQAIVSLLAVALISGLSFARFSRPSARIVFSDKAVVAPYRGGTGFMFRMINLRRSQLVEVRVQIVFSIMVLEGGRRVRKFNPLELERTTSMFFPLHWTVVHPITESSPLHGITAEALAEGDAEFIVLVTGLDETFMQSVHARSSYKPTEVVFGAKFRDMFLDPQNGKPTVDVRMLHDIEPVN